MAIRRSRKLKRSRNSRRNQRVRAQRRADRGLQMEPLEDRRMLAVGPQLVGIQPNIGELLAEGQVRNLAPLELSFLFNSAAQIDRATLPTDEANLLPYDSVQITRAGMDGTFERATVFSDFNTGGAVQIEFEAQLAGQTGSLLSIAVTQGELGEDSTPQVQVTGNVIEVTLNTQVGFETTAQNLVDAINADTQSRALVSARIRSGFSGTNIATPEVTYSPLVLGAVNTASATSSFNADSGLEIQFLARQQGIASNGIVVHVAQADLDETTGPTIATSGKTITITLNSNAVTPTTAQELVDAINADTDASQLVIASIPAGASDTVIGDLAINYSPIVLTGANDVRIEPGYLDLGDSTRQVVMRFQDHLPDDLYMVEILGNGPTPLMNVNGETFNDGQNFQMSFKLDLGAQVVSVVPQPVERDPVTGELSQRRNEIVVYFNDDDLDPASAENPEFYQLIFTADTTNNLDDVVFNPTSVSYDADSDSAVLTFADNLDELVDPDTGDPLGTAAFRLRIGTDEAQPAPPIDIALGIDAGSSFDTAMDVTGFDVAGHTLVLTAAIDPMINPLDLPGGVDEPGHRDIPWVETHLNGGGDTQPGIETILYNFQDAYGFDPQTGQVLQNAITDAQKDRAREVFEFYANYIGVQFIESANSGLTIVTGDMRALDSTIPTGPGGVGGLAGGGMAIMDMADFDTPEADYPGGSWFVTAMHEIGHLLSYGHTYDLPPLTIMGSGEDGVISTTAEGIFPGDHDIVHGEYLHRPESNDIDMYRFDLTEPGLFSAETFAERQVNSSLLDTALKLYRAELDGTGRVIERELISQNDDYYSKDSYIEMLLGPGTYYVGVSAHGNNDYDPAVENTGFGGLSDGDYQLRLSFRANVDQSIVDATGMSLDGDGNGVEGGIYNFWFKTATPAGEGDPQQPQTLFVDKAATAGGDGSLAQPFNMIDDAFTAARPNDVVRIVGNPGADGDITTTGDNLAYQIGFSRVNGAVLEDGHTMEVPQGVTVNIDANAIFKLRRSRIGVGSSAQGIDRSAGSLQVLGTPRILDEAGNVIRDDTGQPVVGSVFFTSLHDDAIGQDNNPDQSPPEAGSGDWGGLVFRNDLDLADASRTVNGEQGIFLNYVNHAEISFGGGSVFINGTPQVVAPLHMTDARPTLTYNEVTGSANAAMSANPDSFEEDNFHTPEFQTIPFTPDYDRVGPEIHHNTVVDNSLNGLFVRVSTPAGQEQEVLTKSARWDDVDIVHLISENLVIQGQPGGPVLEQIAPPVQLVVLTAQADGEFAAGEYEYKMVFVDVAGNEGPASDVTRSVEVVDDQAILLENLPTLSGFPEYVSRRLYRAEAGTNRFELVTQLNADDTDYTDEGLPGGPALEPIVPSVQLVVLTAQPDGGFTAGEYEYKMVFVDVAGNEGPASDATHSVEVVDDQAILLENLPTLSGFPEYVSRRLYRAEMGTDRYELVTRLNASDTEYTDDGSMIGGELQDTTTRLRARLSARLAVDPATVVKLSGSRIDASMGAQLIAEGLDGQPVVFTSLRDDRYGFGGTFDTNLQAGQTSPAPGDWGGLHFGHLGSGSLDFAILAFGGGTTALESQFSGFNVVEIHQSEVRIANSKFEQNADGVSGQAPANRFGLGTHDASTIFVRGAQPIIVNNTLIQNAGAAISINVNALNHLLVNDTGRSTGSADIVANVIDNQGPLVRGNQLADNDLNGMKVRGGTLTTQSVWDDTDIVHVLQDTVVVPNFHTYGGLRLESSPQESLVVKLFGVTAGFTASGSELDIVDRIGGSVQVVGQPRFPVVLTSLQDDSVGAGFTPEGLFQTDTNGDGTGDGTLPVGPEVDRGTLIDNDVATGIPGQFAFQAVDGGASGFAVSVGGQFGGGGGISAQGNTQKFNNTDVIFEFLNFVDVGGNGSAIDLSTTTVTAPASLVSDDLVVSEGTFVGENGTVIWHVESRMDDGISTVFNTLTLSSAQPLGDIRFINYLDEDVVFPSDDLLYLVGTPGENDFRAFTLDGPERIGFSHGGFYEDGETLINATYDGWAADRYADLLFDIMGSGTSYTIPGNIDTTDLIPFDDPELGTVFGLADVTTAFAWSVDPTATTATMTSVLELVPRNPVALGDAGDWRSILVDEFANDRNVDVTTEREPRESTAGPENNQDPDNAQFLGLLAPNEKAGDDNLRLGFEVHGVVSQPGDVDVYSFQADAGTAVWLDIDRTSQTLDSVVELIDANGRIIAQSDNSYAEESLDLALYSDPTSIPDTSVNPLRLSPDSFYPSSAVGESKDLWSTNLGDAGMRIVLPGSAGTTSTYYVRVRSSNLKPGDPRTDLQDQTKLNDGLTSGAYQLQIRLTEVDEIPGTTIQYADIRYATNGIEIYGQPAHSPLQGEAAEDTSFNDDLLNAQPLGNLLGTDMATLAVAGELNNLGDVDFYRFDITFESIQMISGATNTVQHLATILDVDYADGLARPNTRISIFDSQGNLVLSGTDSNIADDRPAPLSGVDTDDLSRGSVGSLDPFVGTQELLAGTYYVAISSDARIPVEYQQFYQPVPANTLFRLEPVNSADRIVEDHINSSYYSTANPPQIPVLFDNDTAVPYHLGDVVLFVSQEISGTSNARIHTVDPFTGTWETRVGDVNRDIADIDMKDDGQLYAFSLDYEGRPPTDGASGNFLQISPGNAATSNLGDDGIETWEANVTATPPTDARQDIGYQFESLVFGPTDTFGSRSLFAVGNRTFPGTLNAYTENVLYYFDANSGAATSFPSIDRGGCGQPGGCRYVGAGTQIVERGHLDTFVDENGLINTLLSVVEATDVDAGTGATTLLITDGLQFVVNGFIYEFNSGPEFMLHPQPDAGAHVSDGDTFLLDGVEYEFDTGSVLVVSATDGLGIADGDTIQITDNQATPVVVTFEFDKDGSVAVGNVAIAITDGMSQAELMTQIAAAINADTSSDLVAEELANSNRITLRNESATNVAVSSSLGIAIEGAPGGAAGVLIPIEETYGLNEFGSALVGVFDGSASVAGIQAGWDGARVNFTGATTGDFTAIEALGVVTDLGSDGNITGNREISFLAEDTADDIANRVVTALTADGYTASATANVARLADGQFIRADAPLTIDSVGPGGRITGLAFIGNTLYAVSDEGGFYRVANPTSSRFASLRLVSVFDDPTTGTGADFQALTNGPTATENGLYQDVLFAMDRGGTMYAINQTGAPETAFVDGQTTVETGLGSVHGMAFSTLEENPWEIVSGTLARSQDAGHGVNTTFDLSRYQPDFPINGNSSLHFGQTRDQDLVPITYDWPGGAHGSMESNTFDLTGYSADDRPVLYYNYFAETEGNSSDPATQTAMYDSLRVFIGDGTGDWDLLSTNNSYDPAELLIRPNLVEETYDNNTGWRQVRIDLRNYAGRDDLQLRIDFSTAGDMNVGDPSTVGSELHIVEASEISDGQTLSIDGLVFEFDFNYTLIAPTGSSITEGDTFTVEAGGTTVVFEFDTDDTVAGSNVQVPFSVVQSALEVSEVMEATIAGEFATAGFIQRSQNRVNLPLADVVDVDPAGAVTLHGEPGTVGIPIVLHAGMPATEVREVVRQAFADTYAGGVTEAFKVHDNVLQVIGHTVTDPGPFGLTDRLPGDNFGNFNNNLRGQNNRFEGIYLDDFIIGFAERGEMATGSAGNSTFYANPELPADQILNGVYQLEVRRGEKYGDSVQAPDRLVLYNGFDTNDRQSQARSITAPSADQISDGQTFTLSDGVQTLTFEFDDININDGVAPGNVEVSFDPSRIDSATGDSRPQSAREMAAIIRDAINSPQTQAILNITASIADGTDFGGPSTSNIVNLFGNVDADLLSTGVTVTSTTTDANLLRDAIIGDLFTPVGNATFEGGVTSAGLFEGGAGSIGIPSGIVLTSGDATFVEGPNRSDGSTGFASMAGDADLDAEFAPFITTDSTVLEFSFNMDDPGDLFFEFVFSSEEYNEFVDSIFNDVFAFFIDGENIGLIPGTAIPVSVNTVNGGNPYGTGGTNEQFYNNNDMDDAGDFLDDFGHDGFTDIFIARKDALDAGVHTIKLAIADVGDMALDSAVFIRAFNTVEADIRTQIAGTVFNDTGDQNTERDQGQIVIRANSITDSAEFGIVVDAGQRSAEGNPHSGPVRVTHKTNDNDLVTGVVITNNLLANGGTGGIHFSGDVNPGSATTSPVPFGRVINNTIYGGGSGVGIQVDQSASPTLLNNIIADLTNGISVDPSSSSTVIGGNLYAGIANTGTSGLGDFSIELPSSNGLFMDPTHGNFYPAESAASIDSSIDSLQDRPEMVNIRGPLGIAPSPILAPEFDLYGQLRVDDPEVASPGGLGENVFKDRGAIDRSDFDGPSALLVNPRDNDSDGFDRDVRSTYVNLMDQTLFEFSIQLIDGIQPSDASNGTGPDSRTVVSEAVEVAKDGVLLEEGIDYRFSYDSTSGVIRLTPLAGIWEEDHTYEISLLNSDISIIRPSNGEDIVDGDSFTITDENAQLVTFEFESGYTIQVPAAGGADITDADQFTITIVDVEYRFEFDDNNVRQTGSIPIPFEASDTADEIAAAIATAITDEGIGLSPVTYSDGLVVLGGDSDTVLDTSGTTLTQAGLPGVAAGAVAIDFVPHVSFTSDDVADVMVTAINGSSLTGVTARVEDGNIIVDGAQSIVGIWSIDVGAITDLAGNPVQPNRVNGSTAFTVLFGSGNDYGDAPASYPVLRADGGARHEIVEGYMLGETILPTADGQPSAGANLDTGDDGVTMHAMTIGYDSTVDVVATGIDSDRPGFLDAWVDFNADGDWNDEGEQIFASVELTAGMNNLEFTVPDSAIATDTYARFRLSSTGNLTPAGSTEDGEVEDYLVTIVPNPWHNGQNRYDVSNDGLVSPIDALQIINRLHFHGIEQLPVPPTPEFNPPPYYDVNNDGLISPLDALQVITRLNSIASEGEAEGEAAPRGLAGESAEGEPLIDSGVEYGGVEYGLIGSELLVTPSQAVELVATAADSPLPVADSSLADTVYLDQVSEGSASFDPRSELAALGYRGEVLEDLLEEIAEETHEARDGEDARDAFFAVLGE